MTALLDRVRVRARAVGRQGRAHVLLNELGVAEVGPALHGAVLLLRHRRGGSSAPPPVGTAAQRPRPPRGAPPPQPASAAHHPPSPSSPGPGWAGAVSVQSTSSNRRCTPGAMSPPPRGTMGTPSLWQQPGVGRAPGSGLLRPTPKGVISGKQGEDSTGDCHQFPGALPSRPQSCSRRTGQPQTVDPFPLFGSQAPGSSRPGPDQEYSHRWPQPAGQWELPSSHFMMCCRWPP